MSLKSFMEDLKSAIVSLMQSFFISMFRQSPYVGMGCEYSFS